MTQEGGMNPSNEKKNRAHLVAFYSDFVASSSRRRGLGKRTAVESSSRQLFRIPLPVLTVLKKHHRRTPRVYRKTRDRHILRLGDPNQGHALVGSIAGNGILGLHRWVSLRTASEFLRRLCISSRRLPDLYGAQLSNAISRMNMRRRVVTS